MTIRESNFDSPPNDEQIKQAKESDAATKQVPESDKALIDKLLKEKKMIEQNRQIFERQWLANIAFLYGKHYFSIEKNPKSGLEERIAWELKVLERNKKTRKTVNYILPLYRSLLSRLLMLKQRIIIDPLTNQERDISAARVSQEALEDFWLNVNKTNPILCQEYGGMLQVLSKLFQYLLIIGKGYVHPYYNEQANAQVYLENLQQEDREKIVSGPAGAVETEVYHAFDVFPDPMKRYKIVRKVLPIDYLEQRYGVTVKPQEVGLSDVEKQLLNLLEGGTDEKYADAAEVFTRWELPSTLYPQGRVFVCTRNEMLESVKPLPSYYKGIIPIFEFHYLDILFGHPQGVVEQLIPSQEEYNHTVSRLHEYKKWMTGKILVPDTCKLQTKWDDQTGQLIKYDSTGGKPEFHNPPNPPSFLMNEIPRIRSEMQDIAASHDASIGTKPKGITANSAIETLSELDQSQLSPQLMHIESQLSFFSDTVLNIMEERYTIPRLVGITGKDLAHDVRAFKGDQISGNRRVKISLGSNLPVSREARQNKITEWLKLGIITKEEARELMEFGNLDGVFHSIDDSAERTEIQEMLKGIIVEAQPWENHTRRLKIITDFMMGEDFKKLMAQARNQANPGAAMRATQIVQAFLAHRKAHQQFLSDEMQAMQQGPGQRPAPQPGSPA